MNEMCWMAVPEYPANYERELVRCVSEIVQLEVEIFLLYLLERANISLKHDVFKSDICVRNIVKRGNSKSYYCGIIRKKHLIRFDI